jgi:hypothetical protein
LVERRWLYLDWLRSSVATRRLANCPSQVGYQASVFLALALRVQAMHGSQDEDLTKALAEAEAAEAELRRLKERLIPRERAAALHELMRAELRP